MTVLAPTHVEFTVPGTAQPAGSKVAGVTNAGRRYVRDDNPNLKEWQRRVAVAAGEAVDGLAVIAGPVRLGVRVVRLRPRSHLSRSAAGGILPSAPALPVVKPDLTKLVRAVEDACTGIVWRDDAQVVETHARKDYAEPDERPHVAVEVEAILDPLPEGRRP